MCFSRKYLFIVILCLGLSGCGPSSMAPNITNEDALREAKIQKEIAMKTEFKSVQRLQDVARPLLIANAPLCGGHVAPYTGMLMQSKATVEKEYRETMAALYGVGEWPTVTLISDRSPASKVLQVGDMITHVNGEPIKSGKAGQQSISKVLENMEHNGVLSLTVHRQGTPMAVSLKTVEACHYSVLYEKAAMVNAFADGKAIHVTQGMLRFVENDEELALVIGHELAHNSRRHHESKQGNAIVGGLLGAVVTVATGVDVTSLGANIASGVHSQAFENEADYVGMYHTARAGYAIEKAPELWRRMGASNPAAIHLSGTSHPSTAKRFLALEATVKEIMRKRASGAALIPEERKEESYKNDGPVGLNE